MNLWFDFKYAWRLLLKSPWHSLLCVVVIALSVGTALWAYVFFYSLSLKPLGFPNSDRWYSVQVAEDAKAVAWPVIDAFTYQEIMRRNRTVNHLGAVANRAAILSEGAASIRLRAAAISPRLLAAMEVPPLLGRLFDETENRPGAPPTLILSFASWKNYFASDPDIVGKQTRIDSQAALIVGVMPETFFALNDSEIWMPLRLPTLAGPSDASMLLAPFIVIENHQQFETALHEIKLVIDDVNKSYPDSFKAGRHAELIAAYLWASHFAQPMMAMFLFLGLAVALLGCMNISMIFLAQLLERSRELALRTALGASRKRLLLQCLIETAFVVVLGLLLGFGLTVIAVHWQQQLVETSIQVSAVGRWWGMPALRSSDVGVAFAIATVVWLLSTLVPARRIAKQDPVIALAGIGKGTVGPAGRSVLILVALQVLVSCFVLVLCGNIVLATTAELNKTSGLDTKGVLVATFPTPFETRYTQTSERLRYWDELTAAIKSKMADSEVAYATSVPTFPVNAALSIETQEVSTSSQSNGSVLTLPVTTVSDNYFSLLGLKLLSGRLFDSTDASADALSVAIVDESTARRYWPTKNELANVLGKRVQLDPTHNGPWLTVIGVVSHARRLDQLSFGAERDGGVIYRPLRQAVPDSFHLIVKPSKMTTDTRAILRAAAFAVDRDLPLHNLQMLDDYRAAMDSIFSGMVVMFSAIAAITTILAATGLFGLISRAVAQRTQEVGVRRALGATRRQVTLVFLREGALHIVLGVIGVGFGVVLTNLIGKGFPNVMDKAFPVTLCVLGLMALVIFTASYLPTRRAVALEPGDALRYE